ncbi:biliverdin-producing heme oxygenase [Sphingomonas sp. PAMC 26621]|uniref:biliverdin-producing heme oxygenase n=1 Tax=Sphingomonas sp. PAMC 26621 TaxID=1112213 RepID=UPI000288BD2C|nr:biliverdin-producing heme oxygenase [Sphingomonas sp. PAMC 26621]
MHKALADRIPVQPRPDLRFVLRDATDTIHQRMHRHPGYARAADGSIGRGAYRNLLARSFGFYAPVEPLAGMNGQASARLVNDLLLLGLSREAIAALPQCPPLAIGGTMPERLGAAYVLAGAALGGQVMARALPRTFPTRFLSGDGIEAGRWRGFVQTLEATCTGVDQRAAATRAAITTFTTFERWMDRWGDTDAE